jgi:hypothetical protein
LVPEEPSGVRCDLKLPEWLGRTPFNDMMSYAPGLSKGHPTWSTTAHWACWAGAAYGWYHSPFDTHTMALAGNRRALVIMRRFYTELMTARLTK